MLVFPGSKRKTLIIGLSIVLAVVVVANLAVGYFLLRSTPTNAAKTPATKTVTAKAGEEALSVPTNYSKGIKKYRRFKKPKLGADFSLAKYQYCAKTNRMAAIAFVTDNVNVAIFNQQGQVISKYQIAAPTWKAVDESEKGVLQTLTRVYPDAFLGHISFGDYVWGHKEGVNIATGKKVPVPGPKGSLVRGVAGTYLIVSTPKGKDEEVRAYAPGAYDKPALTISGQGNLQSFSDETLAFAKKLGRDSDISLLYLKTGKVVTTHAKGAAMPISGVIAMTDGYWLVADAGNHWQIPAEEGEVKVGDRIVHAAFGNAEGEGTAIFGTSAYLVSKSSMPASSHKLSSAKFKGALDRGLDALVPIPGDELLFLPSGGDYLAVTGTDRHQQFSRVYGMVDGLLVQDSAHMSTSSDSIMAIEVKTGIRLWMIPKGITADEYMTGGLLIGSDINTDEIVVSGAEGALPEEPQQKNSEQKQDKAAGDAIRNFDFANATWDVGRNGASNTYDLKDGVKEESFNGVPAKLQYVPEAAFYVDIDGDGYLDSIQRVNYYPGTAHFHFWYALWMWDPQRNTAVQHGMLEDFAGESCAGEIQRFWVQGDTIRASGLKHDDNAACAVAPSIPFSGEVQWDGESIRFVED